jgi:hypothetical protein
MSEVGGQQEAQEAPHPASAAEDQPQTDVQAAEDQPQTDVQNGAADEPDIAPQIRQGGSGFAEVTDVPPAKPKRTSLLFDQAQRLATLPRTRWDGRTSNAFWAGVATAVTAYAGLQDLLTKPPKNAPLSLVEVVIFVLCVGIFLAGVRKPGDKQTSEAYLNELFGIPAPKPGKLRALWKEWMG